MLATEKREFFRMEIKVKTPSVIIKNIVTEFNKLVLVNDDDDEVEITNRRIVAEPVRTTDGFKINLFILNEGDDIRQRIDWLMDEDYEIKVLDLNIYASNKPETKYNYEINRFIGEQIEKEVEIEVPEEIKNSLTFLTDSIECNKEFTNLLYETLNKNSDLVNSVNQIAQIEIA